MNYFLTEILPTLIGGVLGGLFVLGLLMLRDR